MTRKVFCDSGAFSMARKSLASGGKKFYRSKEFWSYIDRYAQFILNNKDCIDFYANVDTSHYPKITWEVQKYLENEYGLTPLPVLHHGEPLKWIDKYLEAGYEYICIGGVAKTKGYSKSKQFVAWGDKVFNMLCPRPSCLPIVKVHGFGITSVPLMIRYPWYSIDSVTWKKPGYFGQIVVPFVRGGRFDPFYSQMIFVDEISPYTERKGNTGKHFLSFSQAEQSQIRQWLRFIKVPWGKRRRDGSIITLGVSNEPHYRCQATIRYFEFLRQALPKWPWPFTVLERPTLAEAIRKNK